MIEPMTPDRLAEIREILTGAGPSIPMGPNALFALHKDRDENRRAAVDLLAEVDRLRALWAAVAKDSRNRKAEADGRRKHGEKLNAENEQFKTAVERVRALAGAARGTSGQVCTCSTCEAEDWNPEYEMHEPTWTGWTLNPAEVLAALDQPKEGT